MTNLTEQWRKGELKEGFYYINDSNKDVSIDYYLCDYWERHFDSEILEVLAPVPSGEEWQQLKEQLSIAIEALECYKQENWTYADEYNYYRLDEYTGGWCHAEKALEKIKELRND